MAATVATTTTLTAISYFNRKTFFCKGNFWLFYSHFGDVYYASSPDAINWTSTLFVAGGGDGTNWAFCTDGTDYVHVARAGGADCFYRRGLLNANGTITWDPFRTVYSVVNHDCYIPNIDLDSSGYPWIGFQVLDTVALWRRPYVSKSSTNDGTWVTDVGFPYQLSLLGNLYTTAIPLGLNSLRVYVLYGEDTNVIRGQLYNAGWGVEENATTNVLQDLAWSACSDGDDVHLLFRIPATPADLRVNSYVKRTYGVGWGAEEPVFQYTGEYLNATISVDKETVNTVIYAFVPLDGAIQFKRRMNGVWDTDAIDLVTGEGTFPGGLHSSLINISVEKESPVSRGICVAWLRNNAAPYDLRFHVLGLLPPSVNTAWSI